MNYCECSSQCKALWYDFIIKWFLNRYFRCLLSAHTIAKHSFSTTTYFHWARDSLVLMHKIGISFTFSIWINTPLFPISLALVYNIYCPFLLGMTSFNLIYTFLFNFWKKLHQHFRSMLYYIPFVLIIESDNIRHY